VTATIRRIYVPNLGPWACGAFAKESGLNKRESMDAFLAGVEPSAYQMARIAIGDADAALDLVQDAMIRLVRNYPDKPAQELRPLFFRILKNRIVDHQRRGNVRNRIIAWFRPALADAAAFDPIALARGSGIDEPERRLAAADSMVALEAALQALPPRQQQAVLLRTIEGLDVAATAAVMGCSEGSVKTHLSRALKKLREQLADHYDP